MKIKLNESYDDLDFADEDELSLYLDDMVFSDENDEYYEDDIADVTATDYVKWAYNHFPKAEFIDEFLKNNGDIILKFDIHKVNDIDKFIEDSQKEFGDRISFINTSYSGEPKMTYFGIVCKNK